MEIINLTELEAENVQLREQVAYWREKCFNDTMAAKLSGYRDAKIESAAYLNRRMEELNSLIKAEELDVPNQASRYRRPGLVAELSRALLELSTLRFRLLKDEP